MKPTILSRITTKDVGLNSSILEGLIDGQGEKPVVIMRVYGTIRSQSVVDGQFGPSIKFKGDFEAVNAIDGAKFRSTALILPEIAENAVISMTTEGLRPEEGQKLSVAMALDITVSENTSSRAGVKYKFGVKPLTDVDEEHDALAKFAATLEPLQILGESPKQIAAPKKKK